MPVCVSSCPSESHCFSIPVFTCFLHPAVFYFNMSACQLTCHYKDFAACMLMCVCACLCLSINCFLLFFPLSNFYCSFFSVPSILSFPFSLSSLFTLSVTHTTHLQIASLHYPLPTSSCIRLVLFILPHYP